MALDEKLALGRTTTAIWFGEEPTGKVTQASAAFGLWGAKGGPYVNGRMC